MLPRQAPRMVQRVKPLGSRGFFSLNSPHLRDVRAKRLENWKKTQENPWGDVWSPEQQKQLKVQNALLGASLIGFVSIVYYYSSSSVHKAPDILELEQADKELLEEEARGN